MRKIENGNRNLLQTVHGYPKDYQNSRKCLKYLRVLQQ